MTADTSLLSADDVLGNLIRWRERGLRTVLVTLVAIDGTTPRPLGAQMAVAENGLAVGYLSGGCIEQAVAEEARRAIAEGANRIVRYGKGSPYFDIKLPCGSGLDLYFDQALSPSVAAHIEAHRSARQAFVLSTDLTTGVSSVSPLRTGSATCRSGKIFHRVHVPPLRVVLAGGGPALAAIVKLIAALGAELDVLTPDDMAHAELKKAGVPVRALSDPKTAGLAALDRWTAAVIAFHEHDWEAPVLAQILRSPAFYVGVMGGKQAHANRLARLTELGVSADDLSRIRSPIGLIAGAKSRPTLAVGILAEVVAEAKAAGMLA